MRNPQRRVLLIGSWPATPQLKGWYLSPPMGLYRLQNWLRDRHAVTVLDPGLTDPLAFLAGSAPYDVYGFSPTKENMANDVALMRYVRRLAPAATIVIGGPEATFNYQRYFELGVADLVILGEGEKPLAALLDGEYATHLPVSSLGQPLSAASVLSPDELYRASALDFAAFPAREYWHRNQAVTGEDILTTHCVSLYLTSFCPHGCKFCSSTRFVRGACSANTGVIAIAPEQVVALVHAVLRGVPEVKTIYFHDDNACYYREATMRWCETIAADRLPVSFVASSRIDHFDAAMLATMRRAGFRKLSCGFEAYSDPLLRAIGKGQTTAAIDSFVAMARDAGLDLHVNTMLCQPEATERDVKETAEFCLRLLEQQGNTVIAEPYIKAYPGSWYHDHWELIEFQTQRSPALPGVAPQSLRVPWRFLPRDPAVRAILARLDQAMTGDSGLSNMMTGNYTKHQLTRRMCELVLDSTGHGGSAEPRPVPLLSVIVPALNEAPTITAVVEEILAAGRAAGRTVQLILVDDGSTDGTGSCCAALAGRYGEIDVVHHAVPRGVGSCYRDGLARARGELVTWFPADGENDASELFRLTETLGAADAVAMYYGNPAVRSPARRLLSRLYQWGIRRRFAVGVRYTNGTAVYRRRRLRDLDIVCNGFLFQAELLIRARQRGWQVREEEGRLAPRRGGRSKAVSWRSLRTMLRDYLRLTRSGSAGLR